MARVAADVDAQPRKERYGKASVEYVALVTAVVAAVVAPAAIGGPTPAYKAVAKVSKPSGGSCTSTATGGWRNVPGFVDEVDFTFFVNGVQSGGEFDNFPFNASKSGSDTAFSSPPVPSGQTFSFDATFKRSGAVVGTASSKVFTC